jgi:pimeloyl-ACP methyl ester carboxylesterase
MLFGTPPISKPMAGEPFLPNPLFSCLFEKELSAEDAAAVATSFFSSDRLVPDFFAEAMLSTDGRARAALWQSVAEGSYTDEVTVAANLSKPLAIVHGEADSLFNPAYIKGLSIPTLWRGEVQMVPDAGHAPHWEQPERFNRLLAEFAADCC